MKSGDFFVAISAASGRGVEQEQEKYGALAGRTAFSQKTVAGVLL
jgi:hypothetical protein